MTVELQAIKDQIVFKFIEDVTNGKFNEKTAAGVLLVADSSKQAKNNRWGMIINTGPDVEDFEPDDVVLIEALQWTPSIQMRNKVYWVTQQSAILATWDDPKNLPKELA